MKTPQNIHSLIAKTMAKIQAQTNSRPETAENYDTAPGQKSQPAAAPDNAAGGQPADELQLSHLWFRAKDVNMLLVDIPETKRLLANYQFDYNETIKAKLLKEFPGFGKEAVAARSKAFKSRSLKTEYLDTAVDLAVMLNGHLLGLRRAKQPFREFTTNNVSLGRKMRDAGKKHGKAAHKATAYRHIRMLMTIPFINGQPFITCKRFHGSHHDYGLMLNENALIAQDNEQYNLAIIQCLRVINNGEDLSPETVENCLDMRPEFAGFFTREWLQVANHSITRNLIENNNLDKAVFVNNSEISANAEISGRDKNESRLQLPLQDSEPEHRGKVAKGNLADTPPVAPAPPAQYNAQESISPDRYHELLETYVKTAMNVMMATLYPQYLLWDEEHKLVTGYLKLYFGTYDHHRNKNSLKIFADRLGEFTRRVVLTQSYILKFPNRYVPSPGKWLNPYNEFGFAGTRKWMEAWREKEKENKDFNATKRLLAEKMLEYSKNPTVKTYTDAVKLLSRKKDNRMKEMFIGFVANRKENYSHSAFQQLQPLTN